MILDKQDASFQPLKLFLQKHIVPQNTCHVHNSAPTPWDEELLSGNKHGVHSFLFLASRLANKSSYWAYKKFIINIYKKWLLYL